MNEIGHILTSIPQQKADYDNVVKSLLANRQFLARILKRFIPEFASCRLHDIENNLIEPGSVWFYPYHEAPGHSRIDGLSNEDPVPGLKAVQYDILFRAGLPGKDRCPNAAADRAPSSGPPWIGICINLEIQSNYYPGYPLEMRGFYYAESPPPNRRHAFRDAKCAARLSRDGWCAARRRMKVCIETFIHQQTDTKNRANPIAGFRPVFCVCLCVCLCVCPFPGFPAPGGRGCHPVNPEYLF